MDWSQQIDAYCERIGPAFWSEPINAVTNLAFILAATIMWRRSEGVTAARVLCAILFLIGVGSFLFHTYATAWASAADTMPIGIYILTYLYLANRDMVGLSVVWSTLVTLMFLPYAAVAVPILDQIPFLRISNFYWTVPILLLAYGWVLRHKHPATARGLVTGAVILSLSISLRSLDEMLCAVWPSGTHFLWHCLNAVMLGYMIHVYLRHVLAGGQGRG